MGASERTGWLVAVHEAALTLSPARDVVVAYDLEGRPTSVFADGDTYKRSLASGLYGRRSEAGTRRRWHVEAPRARALFDLALNVAADARSALRGDTPLRQRGAAAGNGAFHDRLERIAGWTVEGLLAERRRFAEAYAPVSILPPDQYGAVVLQATFGCSWNRCTFCSFYQDRVFEVRPAAAFEAHVGAVRDLLGRDAGARRGVFLADGNALVLANARLEPIFATATAAFPDQPLAGFVDVFSGERKPPRDWRELRDWGLRRVAVGAETGHDPLLAYLNKPGGADAAAAFVAQLKAAGLAVQVILMAGVGGRRFAEAHLRDTARLLERLPLSPGDLVYLSPFVVQPGSAYAERAAAEGLEALTPAERTEQLAALRAAARRAVPAAQVALYPIDEFVY